MILPAGTYYVITYGGILMVTFEEFDANPQSNVIDNLCIPEC